MERRPVAERDGGQVIPLLKEEPLLKECEHFIECVSNGSRPRTDGEGGLRVLEVLDACGKSLRQGGIPVSFASDIPHYFAHPTSIIDRPCEIGEGTKIWHFSHIMSGARIGEGACLQREDDQGDNEDVEHRPLAKALNRSDQMPLRQSTPL